MVLRSLQPDHEGVEPAVTRPRGIRTAIPGRTETLVPVKEWPEAACREYPTDLFYPDNHTPPQRVVEAKRICHVCPCHVECLAWSLEHNESHGIWGGTSERRRRELRRGRQGRPWVTVARVYLRERGALDRVAT